MYLIKSLPATTNASEEESDASTLLLTAVSESAKLLPWVMDNKKQLKAYLKVSLSLPFFYIIFLLHSTALAPTRPLVIGGRQCQNRMLLGCAKSVQGRR